MAPTTKPRVLVHLCVTPFRRPFLPQAIGDLEAHGATVRVTEARAGDAGPIEKWIAVRVPSYFSHVVIIDDDHAYRWASLLAACAETSRPLPQLPGARLQCLVQAAGYGLTIRSHPMAFGGPYLVWSPQHRPVPMRVDIVEAASGVAATRATFLRLQRELRFAVAAHLTDDERWSDDYVVSRAAARLGIQCWAAPLPTPVVLECAYIDPIGTRAGGNAERYKRLLERDSVAPWWTADPHRIP